MTKKTLFFVSAALLLAACQPKHDGYTINGHLAGDADGKKVYLLVQSNEGAQEAIDSTVIDKNRFTLKGKIDEPQICMLQFYDASASLDSGDKKNVLQESFYLENSEITFDGHIDSLKSFFYNPEKAVSAPRISGSKAEDLMNSYRASSKSLMKDYSNLWKQYIDVYHRPAMEGVFNTAEGIVLSTKFDSVAALVKERKLDFIQKNPQSVVSLDFAHAFIEGMYIELSANEMDTMFAALEPTWKDNNTFKSIKEKAEKAKLYSIGAQYIDIPLENKQGETVQLSSVIPQGKYVLLEFWASWCGPCRGEIPHLKHAYNELKSKGFDIVSISIDENKKDWEKALEEEGMAWTQLRADGGFESSAAKEYGILGVPYCMLLNDQGVIVAHDVRGARLEMMLEKFGVK